ncbi:hypothetical protein ACUXIL_003358 [Ralstonia pickettii]|nr:hypothetical protein [Ralstonia pickettii]MBA9852038.1 hypothetical protein [Ralstonia pickettii]MBA9919947.1 hypothetical protein [Ralstonia pickettii]MBA9959049.1 hypothetical protein [Ralstonia pickettii]MBA9964573.1 hypothetical protein [Ralstonia pickettii]
MSTYGQFNLCDRPLAAQGFTSYRCRSRYGWIMIGAYDDRDALSEARRSRADALSQDLEVWDGSQYRPVLARQSGPIG